MVRFFDPNQQSRAVFAQQLRDLAASVRSRADRESRENIAQTGVQAQQDLLRLQQNLREESASRERERTGAAFKQARERAEQQFPVTPVPDDTTQLTDAEIKSSVENEVTSIIRDIGLSNNAIRFDATGRPVLVEEGIFEFDEEIISETRFKNFVVSLESYVLETIKKGDTPDNILRKKALVTSLLNLYSEGIDQDYDVEDEDLKKLLDLASDLGGPLAANTTNADQKEG